jgi:dipeptidase E
MVMTPGIGEDFVRWRPPTVMRCNPGTGRLFDLSAPRPRGHAGQFHADAEAWAAGMSVSAYAIDDQTAIKVTDGTVDVVSEGHWKLFAH